MVQLPPNISSHPPQAPAAAPPARPQPEAGAPADTPQEQASLKPEDGTDLSAIASQPAPTDGPPANTVSFPDSNSQTESEETGEPEPEAEEAAGGAGHEPASPSEGGPESSETCLAWADALGDNSAAILEFISKIKGECDQALLDAIQQSLDRAAEANKKYRQYVQEVVVPREQQQKKAVNAEQVEETQQHQQQRQELSRQVGQIESELQQVFNRLASIPQTAEGQAALQAVAQMQNTVNLMRRDLGNY